MKICKGGTFSTVDFGDFTTGVDRVLPSLAKARVRRWWGGTRYACDHALRDALCDALWSRVASCRDPVWRDRYAQLRQRGKTHSHSLRIIGAQLLRVAITLLKEGLSYDRTR